MERVRRVVQALEADVGGIDGAGVTAAVLDSGVGMHPDFRDRVVGFRDFLGGSRIPYDDCGHGTHVAGILAGDGSCSQGRYRGIASGCRIVAGKVLDQNGDGSIPDMIAGIRWVLEKREMYQIKILNISVSMGKTEKKAEMRELISCLEEAWAAGIFVAVAAGNQGPAPGSLSRLGESGRIVTVGCHENKDFHGRSRPCEEFSGRGQMGKYLRKPDLVAPGTDIMSCNAGFRMTPSGCQNAYIEKNGTSMSTSLVAGTAALCMQKFPWYDNEQVKRKLLWSAVDLGESWNRQGWGMLNVAKALK